MGKGRETGKEEQRKGERRGEFHQSEEAEGRIEKEKW